MRCPKCGKPLVCAACAGSVGGAARVAKGFASAEVQAKAQAKSIRTNPHPWRQSDDLPARGETPRAELGLIWELA